MSMLTTIVFTAAMTLLMGIVLSGVFTYRELGLGPDFASAWVWRFLETYALVLPTVLVVSPVARALTGAILRRVPAPATSAPPVEVAMSAWRANAAGHRGEGFDAWLEHLADDVVVTMPTGPFRGDNEGIEAARAICRGIAAASPRLVYDAPLRVSSAGSTVVIEFDDHGTIAQQPYRNRIAASFDVRDGKVAAYREYFGDIDPRIVSLMAAE